MTNAGFGCSCSRRFQASPGPVGRPFRGMVLSNWAVQCDRSGPAPNLRKGDVKLRTVARKHRPLDDDLQFAYIAWPIIIRERLQRMRGNASIFRPIRRRNPRRHAPNNSAVDVSRCHTAVKHGLDATTEPQPLATMGLGADRVILRCDRCPSSWIYDAAERQRRRNSRSASPAAGCAGCA
jgi:hypothetical protein